MVFTVEDTFKFFNDRMDNSLDRNTLNEFVKRKIKAVKRIRDNEIDQTEDILGNEIINPISNKLYKKKLIGVYNSILNEEKASEIKEYIIEHNLSEVIPEYTMHNRLQNNQENVNYITKTFLDEQNLGKIIARYLG